MFEDAVYGSDISRRYAPVPVTAEQCNQVFEGTGKLLAEAYKHCPDLADIIVPSAPPYSSPAPSPAKK